MALSFVKNLNPTLSYAVWRIEEPLEELVSLYPFTEADRKLLDAHKVESRRAEWLSARLALRALLKTHNLEQLPIHKDEFGKPHLANNQAFISISHTNGWGAAVLGLDSAVGIDIERPKPQIQRIARKFLHVDEAAWAGDHLESLTQIWCAKEALYKLHGRTQLIFAEQLLVDAPEGKYPQSGLICENGSKEKFGLHYDCIDNLYICLAY